MEKLKARLGEPSTWAAIAAGVAILTGHNPTIAADTVVQVVGSVATLAGMFMAENRTPPVA
jgi:uncharacterized membrane protein HdeD (DUF308 family)